MLTVLGCSGSGTPSPTPPNTITFALLVMLHALRNPFMYCYSCASWLREAAPGSASSRNPFLYSYRCAGWLREAALRKLPPRASGGIAGMTAQGAQVMCDRRGTTSLTTSTPLPRCAYSAIEPSLWRPQFLYRNPTDNLFFFAIHNLESARRPKSLIRPATGG